MFIYNHIGFLLYLKKITLEELNFSTFQDLLLIGNPTQSQKGKYSANAPFQKLQNDILKAHLDIILKNEF